MTDPLIILGLICLGMVIAYAVPIGILLFKVRGSTIRLEGLRFVDRSPLRDINWAPGPLDDNLPNWHERNPIRVAPVTKEPDLYDLAHGRGEDDQR